jgi:hypothetical protein
VDKRILPQFAAVGPFSSGTSALLDVVQTGFLLGCYGKLAERRWRSLIPEFRLGRPGRLLRSVDLRVATCGLRKCTWWPTTIS